MYFWKAYTIAVSKCGKPLNEQVLIARQVKCTIEAKGIALCKKVRVPFVRETQELEWGKYVGFVVRKTNSKTEYSLLLKLLQKNVIVPCFVQVSKSLHW